MAVTAGISGVRRNAAVAISIDGAVAAACEHERIVRTRAAGLADGALPVETIETLLAAAAHREGTIDRYVAAEPGVRLPESPASVCFDHHEAHAATAFLTSPFEAAAVLVCDEHTHAATTFWAGRGTTLSRAGRVEGPGLASLYAQAARALGFEGREHELEAIAALGKGGHADRLRAAVRLEDGRIHVAPAYDAALAEWALAWPSLSWHARAEVASSIQRCIGELLVELAGEVKRRTGAPHLCLGGGLFYNTYFTTAIAVSHVFDRVFVPDNPGNGGLAIGAALLADATGGPGLAAPRGRHPVPLSSFLGPAYDDASVKATLDNCKLSYAYLSEGGIVEQVVDAMRQGALVGWFEGRMEWGHRALGNRSILANPGAPYALENLNVFLKHRQPWRRYGLATPASRLAAHFAGPPASDRMEYEYEVLDRDALRRVLPTGADRVRVQTVTADGRRFGRLLDAFASATGVPAVVNTSFNGFHEPIVCSPRDAVRVFYGTGLDLLVMGNFLLRK